MGLPPKPPLVNATSRAIAEEESDIAKWTAELSKFGVPFYSRRLSPEAAKLVKNIKKSKKRLKHLREIYAWEYKCTPRRPSNMG